MITRGSPGENRMKGKVKYSPVSQTGESEEGFSGHPSQTQPGKSSPQSALVWRAINLLMSVFFLLAALVQVNDPDPYVWVPAYVVPAIFTLAITIQPLVTMEKWWRVLVVIHMALCLSGSLYLTGVVFDLLRKDMNNPLIHEEGRELGGLVIIMIWLWLCRFTRLGNNEPGKGSMSALLLVTAVLGLMPLGFWGLCFVSGISEKLSHCKDMFDGGVLSRLKSDHT